MTRVYFVRHAQPQFSWADDLTRPLTEEGMQDRRIVLEFLQDKKVDVFFCSPYQRSYDTIAEAAAFLARIYIPTHVCVSARRATQRAIPMICFRSVGRITPIMRRVVNPSLWCRSAI